MKKHTNLTEEVEIYESPKESKLVWLVFGLLALGFVVMFIAGALKMPVV